MLQSAPAAKASITRIAALVDAAEANNEAALAAAAAALAAEGADLAALQRNALAAAKLCTQQAAKWALEESKAAAASKLYRKGSEFCDEAASACRHATVAWEEWDNRRHQFTQIAAALAAAAN